MQTKEDADRLRTLGIPAENLFIAGNLKFDVPIPSSSNVTAEELKTRFKLDSEVPLILAASTHAPEERIILESIKQVRTKQPVRLLLAPRKPERFDEVATLLQKSGLSWARRKSPADPNDANVDVILLDTIGELPATFTLAQIVFVGGSLMKQGGHNVVEPAAAGVPVVTGPHTDNFHNIIELMKEAGAIIQLPEAESRVAGNELASAFAILLESPAERDDLGRRAKQLVIENQGATDKTLKLIAPLFAGASRESSPKDQLLANAHTS
jgi:3-deoxy-D-manno-octulosonic-acid transferase